MLHPTYFTTEAYQVAGSVVQRTTNNVSAVFEGYTPGDVDSIVSGLMAQNIVLRNENTALRLQIQRYLQEIAELREEIVRQYRQGYTDGFNQGQSQQINLDWLLSCADSFLNLELFKWTDPLSTNTYTFTLKTLLTVTVGATSLLWILKIFAGG